MNDAKAKQKARNIYCFVSLFGFIATLITVLLKWNDLYKALILLAAFGFIIVVPILIGLGIGIYALFNQGFKEMFKSLKAEINRLNCDEQQKKKLYQAYRRKVDHLVVFWAAMAVIAPQVAFFVQGQLVKNAAQTQLVKRYGKSVQVESASRDNTEASDSWNVDFKVHGKEDSVSVDNSTFKVMIDDD